MASHDILLIVICFSAGLLWYTLRGIKKSVALILSQNQQINERLNRLAERLAHVESIADNYSDLQRRMSNLETRVFEFFNIKNRSDTH